MKTILAAQKSEYLHCLMECINYKLSDMQRRMTYHRLQEIEKIVKDTGDEIQIIITTKNTNRILSALPMSMEDIEKS